jgi:hypothetical protein
MSLIASSDGHRLELPVRYRPHCPQRLIARRAQWLGGNGLPEVPKCGSLSLRGRLFEAFRRLVAAAGRAWYAPRARVHSPHPHARGLVVLAPSPGVRACSGVLSDTLSPRSGLLAILAFDIGCWLCADVDRDSTDLTD